MGVSQVRGTASLRGLSRTRVDRHLNAPCGTGYRRDYLLAGLFARESRENWVWRTGPKDVRTVPDLAERPRIVVNLRIPSVLSRSAAAVLWSVPGFFFHALIAKRPRC